MTDSHTPSPAAPAEAPALAALPPPHRGLIKLRGVVTQYQRTKGQSNFMLTEADQTGMGMVAIAAGLAGLSGQAISTASNVGDASEDAHWVEFTLDGIRVGGWLWRSPLMTGDVVEAAVYWDGQHYQLQGVYRLKDGMVALHPHCSRGVKAHTKNAFKWWAIVVGVLYGCLCLMGTYFFLKHPLSAEEFWPAVRTFFGGGFLFLGSFCALAIYSMSRQWLPMAKAAQAVFHTLGWAGPESIDLVKSSKQLKRGNVDAEYGVMYFRYFPKK